MLELSLGKKKYKMVLQQCVLIRYESRRLSLLARNPVDFSRAVAGRLLWSVPELECAVPSCVVLQDGVSACVNKAPVIFAIRRHSLSL